MVRFSVIIPTFARPGRVRACLAAVGRLAYPRERFEVIVVDDGSPTPPDAEVAEFAGRLPVRLLRQPNAGPGAARNTGAAAAAGQFLAFTADDCAPAPDWLAALDRAFVADPDRLLGGRVEHGLPGDACATASHLLIDYLYAYYNRDPARARFFTPNNMAVPAARFAEVGGFDGTTGATGEDRELCGRWLGRGWAMAYVAGAVVSHAHPLTLGGFLRQQYAYGVGSQKARELAAARLAATGAVGDGRRGTPEPLSFYRDLVLHPLRYGRGPRAWGHVGLMLASQAVNAAGVAAEALRRERPVPTTSPTPAFDAAAGGAGTGSTA